MIPSDLEERLKRIVEGGAVPPPQEDVGLDLEGIRALGEGFTESGGEDFPAGTKVAFGDDLEVSAPVRKPLVARAPDAEKVVQVPSGPEQDPDRIAAAYARAQDKEQRSKMAMERGGRELVAGLTRTQAQPVTQRPVDAFDRYAQQQRQKQTQTHQQNQERLGADKVSFDRAEAARKAALSATHRQEDLDERERDNERAEEGLEVGRENAAANRALAGASFAATQKNRASGDLSDLRKEFNALPDVKAFNEVDASFKKIESAATNDSPAGDLALVTGFMKIIDPGSSVKEGEFANAENAGGVPDKIRARYNSIVNGERLAPAQRADFLKQAKALHDVHQKRYSDQAQRYRGLAERQGASPDDVVTTQMAPKDQAALQWAKANPKDPRAAEILRKLGVK